jgi:hypothetical protein
MKGKRYNTENDLVQDTELSIRDINNSHCLIGIKKLPERWQKIIDKKGDYHK